MGIFDTSVNFSGAENTYDQSMQQILAMINSAQQSGRTDISDYLQKAFNINQPYMSAGTNALSAYQNSLGIGDQGAKGQQNLMNQFQQNPGFQYALKQAQNASTRQANASGQGMSGAENLQLQSNAQGMANQDWTSWLNNYQNRLSDIAGMGQRSSMQQAGLESQGGENLANLGLQYTGMSANMQEDMAKAKAEAQMAQQEADAQSNSNWLSSLGSIAGGVGGFMLGGPAGAAMGYKLGGGLGGGSSGGNLFGGGGSGGFGGFGGFGGGNNNSNDYAAYGGYQGYQNWLQNLQ